MDTNIPSFYRLMAITGISHATESKILSRAGTYFRLYLKEEQGKTLTKQQADLANRTVAALMGMLHPLVTYFDKGRVYVGSAVGVDIPIPVPAADGAPSVQARPARQHLLQTAGYWFNASRTKSGPNATLAMEQAYNHVENALAHLRDVLASTAEALHSSMNQAQIDALKARIAKALEPIAKAA